MLTQPQKGSSLMLWRRSATTFIDAFYFGCGSERLLTFIYYTVATSRIAFTLLSLVIFHFPQGVILLIGLWILHQSQRGVVLFDYSRGTNTANTPCSERNRTPWEYEQYYTDRQVPIVHTTVSRHDPGLFYRYSHCFYFLIPSETCVVSTTYK
jgi:hypothetical protein